ncbi:NAD(P)/FAD-dependent oxidoreductase [Kangiella taiwanensis]|uniref:NAD(P)/FAD-dependent oxidoreductase n=1 Tax=Kangiella taiwanensis TaxID=1079179 RepID=A0ABP8HXC5_9GAMM|nr:NAD(P)/FAD-dependent oxidoreductase [Kangiella taiwanensis]
MTHQPDDNHYDVVIIGAGPAGSLAASLLTQADVNVLVIEKQHFPRFSIGESLLPQSMVYLEEAGLLSIVEQAADKYGFQYKNGAVFSVDNRESIFEFDKKFSDGPEYTYQVKRAEFDQLLAQEAQNQGATFTFGVQVNDVTFTPKPSLTLCDEKGMTRSITAEFVLDASGFARVLPRLLNLDTPSDFPIRSSLFCHIKDDITDPDYDRNKILVETHPEFSDVWYWLIPFADGTASVGCVAEPRFFEELEKAHSSKDSMLFEVIGQSTRLQKLLSNATMTRPVQQLTGYSSNVKSLFGDRFALLGNAGEFLDPIFSSGVTIAFKSAKLASDCVIRQLQGEDVCWNSDFSQPLQKGVHSFKAFVQSWYQGELQSILQFEDAPSNIREMICSVLAGYAWDLDNPYNTETDKRLQTLGELCAF